MKALSNSDKLVAFISPKMTYLITFLDNNRKYTVYTGGDFNGIYSYLEIIVSPTTLTALGQRYHHFSPSSSINNDKTYLRTVNASLRTRQKNIFECCGRVVHKYDACIIRGTNFLPPSLRINMNQSNALHGDQLNESPKEWGSQPPAANFKFSTSPSNTIPVVSAIMGRLNRHAIDNGDVKVQTLYFPVEFNSESVPDLETTPIKSIHDDEMDHLL